MVKVNKRFWKTVLSCVLVCLLLFSMCISAFALSPASELPVVQKWVNGAALSDSGGYLHDTWAVDKSGVSDSEYVLISQESAEVFRVKKYPDDVNSGNTVVAPQYTVTIHLSVPETLTEEVILTFESDSAVNTVSFTKKNNYEADIAFYPGGYAVSDVEVPVNNGVTYKLAESNTVTVIDKNVSAAFSLVAADDAGASNGASEDEDGNGSQVVDESDKVNVGEIISGFDADGDLLADTVKLVFAVIILFAVYGVVKYRRKKKEEIDR